MKKEYQTLKTGVESWNLETVSNAGQEKERNVAVRPKMFSFCFDFQKFRFKIENLQTSFVMIKMYKRYNASGFSSFPFW